MTNVFPPGPADDAWMATFAQNRLGVFFEAAQQYGELVHFWVGKKRHLYVVSNLDLIRFILVDHPELFSRGLVFKRRAGRVVGTGLITSDGSFHDRQRRLMVPAFHHSRIATYATAMVQETLRLLDDWNPDETRDIHHDMMRVTMNIVMKTLFGGDVFGDTGLLGQAITAGVEYLNDDSMLEPTDAIALLDRMIGTLIAERRESGEDRGDLLSMLLAAKDEDGGGQMDDKQIRDEVMTLFLAGHETSANSISWMLYLLSQYPAVEAKLVEELDRVLQGRTPTLQDLPQLLYTEMVIKESLRLYAPIWNQTREVLEEFQLGDYTIPKGSTLIVSPYIVHHDPRYWENPEHFDPERFAEGYEKRIRRGSYFPFSYGPRNCIGQAFAMVEMQLMLATIVQRFHLALATQAPVDIEMFIALRPKGGLPMTIGTRTPIPMPSPMG